MSVVDYERSLVPFLKWAGGKRWLARAGAFRPPTTYGNYIEPFLGGGAVFFSLLPARAILSDINAELIELYTVMRDDPSALWALMLEHQAAHGSTHYYDVRKEVPSTSVKRAARTLYLNRTCWNGLYRVNRRGEFNVPIGTKSSVVFEGEDFHRYSAALRSATLIVSDFERTIRSAKEGDFLFVDPPYTVRHNQNGFLKYNESIFSWDDQVRLHRSLKQAATRGAMVAITNADHESVHTLFSSDFSYSRLERSSVLAGKSDYRGDTSEALFTANL